MKFTGAKKMIFLAACLVILTAGACQQQDPEAADTGQGVVVSAMKQGGSGEVSLYDRGLQMDQGSYDIPRGWRLRQNIATDPGTGQQSVYQVEIRSDGDEWIRALGMASYANFLGQQFQPTWQNLVLSVLHNDFQRVSLGQPGSSESLMELAQVQQAARRAAQQGNRFQAVEVPLTAMRNGKRFNGLVQFAHITPENAPFQQGVILGGTITIAPEGRLEHALEAKRRIDLSFTPNPAFQQRIAQITQRARARNDAYYRQQMATSRAAHEARMRNQQALFDRSQRNIADMNRIRDQQHAQFMGNLRGTGSTGQTGTGYDGQAAVVDQIYGRSSFNDPDTGQVRSMDGQYKYNYTDGLGHYHRTDDPNFDPASLPGDWRQTDPLSPQH